MVRIQSSPDITPRYPIFWPCRKWCDLNFTSMSPSSPSKLSMASGAMSPIIVFMPSLWAVIDSRMVVIVGATIIYLFFDVEDGGHREVNGRSQFSHCIC